MKAWKVGDIDHHVGWIVFRARSRSAARYKYVNGFLDDPFDEFPKLFAWRYPHADTDDDQEGEVPFSELTPEDQNDYTD